MSKESVFRAIIDEKCPRCHTGNLFTSTALNVMNFYRMHRYCPVCVQTFEPEPGFYFGAMFISYGLSVIMSIIIWIGLFFVFHPAFAVYVIIILILNVLLLPFIFRYSRTFFLFGFGGISFDNNILKK